MSVERRSVADAVELRSSPGRHPVIRGYAAVFNQWTTLAESDSYVVRERILPGAFNNALRERQDVRALFNHDPSLLLGRTTAGTCRLSVDAHGLAYEVDSSPASAYRQTVIYLERKEVTGSSFGFKVRKGGVSVERRQEAGTDRTIVERELSDLDLFDVSPVTYPAYVGTDVALRSGSPDAVAMLVRRFQTEALDARIDALLQSELVRRGRDVDARLRRLEALDASLEAAGY